MYAIVPLKSCPHLTLLRPDEAPECRFRFINDIYIKKKNQKPYKCSENCCEVFEHNFLFIFF